MKNSRSRIVPVIVSGGQGTRLWPLSRANMPKQFIPFIAGVSLFEFTLDRVANRDIFTSPIIVCAKDHRFHIVDMLKARNIDDAMIVCEQTGRNTAPAFCVGALAAKSSGLAVEETQILMLPADHYIPDINGFCAAVLESAKQVEKGVIATYGILPRKPHTGFGYIEKGEAAGNGYTIRSFKEKPDYETAKTYLETGRYLWNAGIFQMRCKDLMAAFETYCPAVPVAVKSAWDKRVDDLGDSILDKHAFEQAPAIGFDHAVMEKTDKAWVMPASFLWDDLGSWDALWDISEKDKDGNVAEGNVIAIESEGTYLRSTGQMLCAIGIKDIIAIATDDSVLIMPRQQSESIKILIDTLKAKQSPALNEGGQIYRPWGHYETLMKEPGFRVLRVTILPGRRFSLHKHARRTEHWMVVKGQGHVIKDDEHFDLEVNQSTYIPIGVLHRMENRGESALELIEVQSGDYLGSDDMIRVEDDYNRPMTKTTQTKTGTMR
jgi:mannose-1-phosphate guanylyltransferase / mannose-6-phosphate isomerase